MVVVTRGERVEELLSDVPTDVLEILRLLGREVVMAKVPRLSAD